MFFLAEIDPRARVKGSRDGLGAQAVWSALGRPLIGNLTLRADLHRPVAGRRGPAHLLLAGVPLRAAWTPSATEQRIGRVDRVRWQTERRLTALDTVPDGDELLQVYYPYLVDTVERLQVRRVLRRMNDFTRLMHEGLGAPPDGDGHLDVAREALLEGDITGPPAVPLETSFPVREEHLVGDDRHLAVERRDHRADRLRGHT